VWLIAVVFVVAPSSSAQGDILEHFKYGALGAEERAGVPYWIWRVLPIVFADKLPNRPGSGWEKLGFIYESSGRDRPIGTTNAGGLVKLAGLNCATCHAGTYRETPTAVRRIVLGMPANQMDLQGYLRFLTASAQDSRFTAGNLIAAIEKVNPKVGFFEKLVYRLIVVSRTRSGILDRAKETAWFDSRPPQGPGRVDTFNPYKVLFQFNMAADNSVGTVDLPSLWNQRPRRGLWLHWDGNNDLVEERNKSAAIGAGATPDSLDVPALARIEDWILDLKPPPYPAARIDATRAARGRPIYANNCASCHDLGAPEVGQVTPLDKVGTDPERVNSFTKELSVKMNTLGEGKPWRFSHFRKTNGYANMPLDGLWLRAPYLHNGSVPTLRALLFPETRPTQFYRGYDVYDWNDVGFVSNGPDAAREGVALDTRLKGNSNAGHVYGQELKPAQREDLLEYLKTL
jgi:RoxA-like, cytochrome c-like/Cytochrome C oxidase, cbb3-type, subunit III